MARTGGGAVEEVERMTGVCDLVSDTRTADGPEQVWWTPEPATGARRGQRGPEGDRQSSKHMASSSGLCRAAAWSRPH